jgi:hypothetical protein
MKLVGLPVLNATGSEPTETLVHNLLVCVYKNKDMPHVYRELHLVWAQTFMRISGLIELEMDDFYK